MDLSTNILSRKIPPSLGNLSLLNELYLSTKRLEGTIPSSLGNFTNLYALFLSQNSLSGTIPTQLFNPLASLVSLDLAQNNLVGSLPSEIATLERLSELDVSENELSGEIPSSLGGCVSLEYLYMEGNFFQGSIPPSLSSLRGIQDLDLSRNNLSGQIPSFLENFSLLNLNLSFNNFEGEVPVAGVFTNASIISVVGNKKLCGGILELQLPKCTIKESKKTKMSLALILIITMVFTLVGVSMVTSLLFSCFKRKRKDQSAVSLVEDPVLKLSYGMLLKATNGFSLENFIGAGSFGSVYKGILDGDGTIVAIKVLNLQREGASRSFMAECEALANIRHRNLIKIVTSCSSVDFQGNEFKALIYEFMPNGSLEEWLHPVSKTNVDEDKLQNLNFLQRINCNQCSLCTRLSSSPVPYTYCSLRSKAKQRTS
ncbi:hypothetical protein L1049_011095 [Liquidambar formosana]|uniref:Protein kinase domain-containing protein n=1 Tax=Liquidambar formosana TaxID=63359 RepID=A0AAP0RR67_LIQFO